MKKFIIPIVLLVLVGSVFLYLGMDFSTSSFDGTRYLEVRKQIDATNMELFEAKDNAEARAVLVAKQDSLWGLLVALRTASPAVTSEKSVATPTQESAPTPQNELTPASDANLVTKSTEPFPLWILGVLGGVIVGLILIFLLLRKRQEAITRQMEQIRSEQRFKSPKGGFQEDPTFVTRTRVRRSIIEDAEASASEASKTTLPKDFAFEDENGIPENRIYPANPQEGAPTLRPTARNRITSAMQSLSDALTLKAPKGVARENTMKVRAQSRNTMSSSTIGQSQKPNPMDVTRFDKERDDKEKVLQLMRRGYTSSEIARRTQLPQDQVETVIRVKRDTGE